MLPELLEEVPLHVKANVIYQHDAAPAHCRRDIYGHLNTMFRTWIGNGEGDRQCGQRNHQT